MIKNSSWSIHGEPPCLRSTSSPTKGLLSQQVWNSGRTWFVIGGKSYIWWWSGVCVGMSWALHAVGKSSWHKQVNTGWVDSPPPCVCSTADWFGRIMQTVACWERKQVVGMEPGSWTFKVLRVLCDWSAWGASQWPRGMAWQGECA